MWCVHWKDLAVIRLHRALPVRCLFRAPQGRCRPTTGPLPCQAESRQELLLATPEDAHIDFRGETCFGAAVL